MQAVTHVDALVTRSEATHPREAARALVGIVLVGAAVSALTWRADAGLGWFAADAALVVAIVAGIARGRPGAAGWVLAAASLWLAGSTCWHASDWAMATAFPGSVAMLGALALVAARRLRATQLGDVGQASIDALRTLPGGIADAARLPVSAFDAEARGRAVNVVRGALVGIPLAGLFALILSADAQFRHVLVRLVVRSSDALDLATWMGGTTLVLLVAFAVLRRVGGTRAATGAVPTPVVFPPYRLDGDAPPPALAASAAPRPRVRVLTWGVVLAHLVGVFGLYVIANAGTLFVGHAQVRARGWLTYAEYVHEGFAQVSVATLLAVACVVVGHVLLRPRGAASAGGIPGGRALAAVEVALLALVGVTLASSAHRLSLYEEAYGYTYLRLGVWLLQLGVGGLLAMTAARSVARRWSGWGTALAWSGVAFALLAGSLDADGWIARRNVARAERGAGLDVEYLATLSEDARPVLPDVRRIEPDAAPQLDQAWSASQALHRGHGWRSRRGLGAW